MKTRAIIDKTLEFVLVAIMVVLVIDVLWQVISRYLLQSPSSFTDELARFLLIWVGILGAAYAAGQRMHLAIDVFINRFKDKQRDIINKLIHASVALFALCVMVIGGVNLMFILLKLGNTSPALSVPIGYVYSVIPISGALIIYYSLFEIISDKKDNPAQHFID